MLEHEDDLTKQLDELEVEEDGIRRKLTEAEKTEVLEHLYKTAETSSDYSSVLARSLNKIDDKVSQKIKNFEDQIKHLEYEDGLLVNNAKKLELKHTGKKYPSKIDWNNYSRDQFSGSTITHNHPNGSGLSLADVQMFLHQDLREIRAVCKDGSVYSMKNIKIAGKIRKILTEKLALIEIEMKQVQKIGQLSDDFVERKIFTKFYKELEPYIDYVKYIN